MKHALGFMAIGAPIAECAATAPTGPSAVADLAATTGSATVGKDPDDFKTQPASNSGARVACGVIRKS